MRNKGLDALFIRAPKLNQLNILNQLGLDPFLTQATLATRCSLSVAMVNNYMKELCSAGLLEYRRKSSKSVSYHLTPAGKEQVETIERELVQEFVQLFREGKRLVRDCILSQAVEKLHRVILYGHGDMGEMTFHALESAGIKVIGVFDDDPANIGREWCGREMLNPTQIRFMAPDAIVIADSACGKEIPATLQYLQDRGIRLITLNTCRMNANSPSRDSNSGNQALLDSDSPHTHPTMAGSNS